VTAPVGRLELVLRTQVLKGREDMVTLLPATANLAPPATADPATFRRLLAVGLTGAGLFLLPWMGYLAVSLPASTQAFHWPVAWVGLDAMEAAGLLSTPGTASPRWPRRPCW
jgi:hypothetical protein